jgi:L-asparagine transporter-like permease
MLFALGRDRLLDQRLAAVSSTGAPAGGLAFVMTLDLAILVVFGVAKAKPIDVFFYFATIGTLSLLTMYVMTNVAATRFLFAQGSRLELVLPLAGIAVALYVLYHNVYPVPHSPYDAFPYVVAGWLAVGVGFAAWRGR